jgi:hypothetical protein
LSQLLSECAALNGLDSTRLNTKDMFYKITARDRIKPFTPRIIYKFNVSPV